MSARFAVAGAVALLALIAAALAVALLPGATLATALDPLATPIAGRPVPPEVKLPPGPPPPLPPGGGAAPRVTWPPFTMVLQERVVQPGAIPITYTVRIAYVSDNEWRRELLSIRDDAGRDLQDPHGTDAGSTVTYRDGISTACNARFRTCTLSDVRPGVANVAPWLDPYRTANLAADGFVTVAETAGRRTVAREETVTIPPVCLAGQDCSRLMPSVVRVRETREYDTARMLPLRIAVERDGRVESELQVTELTFP